MSAVTLVMNEIHLFYYLFKRTRLFIVFRYVFIVGKVHLAQHLDHETAASGSYPSGGNDNVDYGAYTGGYGAFGWYTDHPVGNYGSY